MEESMVEGRQTALELATVVLAALEDGAWSRVAAHVSPTASAAFRNEQLERARQQEMLREVDWSGVGVPAAVAEWFRGRAPGPSLLERIYGVKTALEFEQLSPTTVVERFIRTKHARHPEGGASVRRQVVGAVAESDDLVQVVFRRPTWHPAETPESSVDVLTVRRTPEGWRCELNGGLIYNSSGGYSMSFYDRQKAESGEPAA
jgi:hypothetical protein